MRRALAAAAAASALALAVTAAASPAGPQVTTTTPVTHLVILTQENHTADSELGFYCDQVDAGLIARAMGCTGMPAQIMLSNGAQVTPGTTPDLVPAVKHSTEAQQAAIDGGKMDGWQNVQGCAAPSYPCISGYQPAAIPNLAALATSYALADRAFTQHQAASWVGHLDTFAGTNDTFLGNNPYATNGNGWGCDSNGLASRMPVNGARVGPAPSCIPCPASICPGLVNGGAFEPTTVPWVPTIMDRMDAAGVSWKIYSTAAPGPSDGYQWAGCPSFADCLDTGQHANLQDSGQFFADAKAGTLPAVSFIQPGGANVAFSQHNQTSNAAGDNWIGRVASAAMTGPEASSTAVIITYDDCGCFYDSVPPPAGMGPRVPFLLVSPWAKPGYTDSTTISGTASPLAFIEYNWGLPSLGAADQGAGSILGMFSFTAAHRVPFPAGRIRMRRLPARDYRVPAAVLRDAT